MTYEYYKSNYDKLSKQERNTNKDFKIKFLEEAHQIALQQLKKNMDEKLDNYKKEIK